MAFSFGFFNSKGMDRTYTAEDFCDYLGSLICSGVQDSYGDCFAPAVGRGLHVTLGSGKAWMNGHYFISNDNYSINLTRYQDENLPRYVSIGIVLDTSEAAREIKIEVVAGTPAEEPAVPDIPAGGSKTALHLYAVRLSPDQDVLTEEDIIDYRDDESKCGYCKCILGKCKVADMLAQFAQVIADIEQYQDTVDDLENRIAELEIAVEDIGDIVAVGQCGESVFYVQYSTGKVLLRGLGPMYDYDLNTNVSPFYRSDAVKEVVISNGITTVGDNSFERCLNMESVTLPTTLTSIGTTSFMPADETMGYAGKLESIHIPASVTTLKGGAFWGAALKSLTVPRNVANVERYVFNDCTQLATVRYEGSVIGGFMFVHCESLRSFTMTSNVTEIGEHCFNYCGQLETITYEGTLDQWAAITKQNNWAGKAGQGIAKSGLTRIQCTDGHLDWDDENKEWVEVRD